jgi:hypothetical protein
MGQISLKINNELDKRFRDEVNRRLGMKKGNIKIALEQAMELWINQQT